MSAERTQTRTGDRLLLGGAVLMILCCAIGPAVIGAAAGSAIGGGLGIVVACVVAVGAGLGVYWHRRRKGC
jgi:hypothetical protein